MRLIPQRLSLLLRTPFPVSDFRQRLSRLDAIGAQERVLRLPSRLFQTVRNWHWRCNDGPVRIWHCGANTRKGSPRTDTDMPRHSVHIEPQGPLQTARHYVRELIYGANDGIITTFAVVAGVAGGGLSLRVVLIIGAANLFADGLSMAAGNYLSIRSHESVLQTQDLPEEEAFPARHAAATFLAFVVGGTMPLLPYMIPGLVLDRFILSIFLTFSAMFVVGASRSLIANVQWWTAGGEMLGLGALVAGLAYLSGAVVSALVGHI